MIVQPIKTRVFKENEDIIAFITHYIPKVKEGSVIVVTSKIVALAEGRTEEKTDVKTKMRLIKAESDFALPTKWVWLTLKDGYVAATAGIDESNADGKLILLPKDSFASATYIRNKLKRYYKVKRLGVIVPDSRTTPLRAGVTAVAIGYAGVKGIREYRGTRDMFGRIFRFEQVNVVDSLSTAAALAMGEGAEQQPLALITQAPVEFVEKIDKEELRIPLEDDIYLPFLSKLPIKRLRKKAKTRG